MFSCKCSKIFKNTFFIEHPRRLLLHFVQRKRSKQPSVQGSTIHSTFNTANLIFRRSHPEMFLGKRVVKICSKLTGEPPHRSVISIKLLCKFIEITLRHGCSHVNLLHFFRTAFTKNTSGWLLLVFLYYSIC